MRRELHHAFDFDAHVWLLTDPGSDPHADVSALGQPPSRIKFNCLTTVNRWTDLAAPRVDVASHGGAAGGDMAKSRLWREVLKDFRVKEVKDVASIIMVDRYGCCGFPEPLRSTCSTAFDDQDLAFLRHLAPVLTRATGSHIFLRAAGPGDRLRLRSAAACS